MNQLCDVTQKLSGGREVFALPTITAVLLSCDCQLVIEVGTWPACLEVDAAEGHADAVAFAADGGMLAVYWAANAKDARAVTVTLRLAEVPDLIENHDAGAVSISGQVVADYLTLRNEGSGVIRMDAQGEVGMIDVELDGAGSIAVRSPVARKGVLTALRTSTGEISARIADGVEANAWGSGTVRVCGEPSKRQCSVGDGTNGGRILFEEPAR